MYQIKSYGREYEIKSRYYMVLYQIVLSIMYYTVLSQPSCVVSYQIVP